MRKDGQTDITFDPLQTNAIVPSHLRYMGTIIYSRIANIYSSELDAAPRGNQWLRVPTQGGRDTKPRQSPSAAGTATIYQLSSTANICSSVILLYTFRKEIFRKSFISKIVTKESNGLVGSGRFIVLNNSGRLQTFENKKPDNFKNIPRTQEHNFKKIVVL